VTLTRFSSNAQNDGMGRAHLNRCQEVGRTSGQRVTREEARNGAIRILKTGEQELLTWPE
jgi:hypothetical protein